MLKINPQCVVEETDQTSRKEFIVSLKSLQIRIESYFFNNGTMGASHKEKSTGLILILRVYLILFLLYF